jgi:hypothetical protein
MKEVDVIIIKTKQIGFIAACNLPLIENCNYCVRLDNKGNLKKWVKGKEVKIIENK